MAYIGKQPIVGNFQICDAISVVNGQAAYTMQVASTNVSPESASHMLVSLNGILQKPGSSFTVSGATITFASNLATGDVIDFIILLGDALNLGTPSDGTVATAKIAANAVTAAKFNADVISGQTALASAPADTDEFLVSDAGVLKRIDYSLIKGGGQWEFISELTGSSSTSALDFTTLSTDFKDFCFSMQNMHPESDNIRLYMRVFTGSGGSQAIVDSSTYGYAGITRVDSTTTGNGDSANHMRVTDLVGNAATENASGEVFLYNPHGTTFHKLIKSHSVTMRDDDDVGIGNWAGKYVATTAVTGVRFYFASGEINGKIAMYGRKRS